MIESKKRQTPPPGTPAIPEPAADLDQSYLASLAALAAGDAPAADDVDDGGTALPPSRATAAPRPAAVAAWHQVDQAAAEPAGGARKRTPEPKAIGTRADVVLSVSRSPARVALGVLAIAAGIALMVFYFPSHAPDAPERGPGGTFVWRFTESLYLRARLAAGGLIAVGLLFTASGMWFRPQAQVICRRCRLWVVATRDGISLRCPRSSHVARNDTMTILLAGLLIAAIVGVLLAISFGSIVRG